jgi:excisionase family DNA binding protein
VEEAAVFLGTTSGQLYNLLNRREIPYVPWGKRGKRFRRIDLIAWQEDRKRPALS